jgi:hypothetical protein
LILPAQFFDLSAAMSGNTEAILLEMSYTKRRVWCIPLSTILSPESALPDEATLPDPGSKHHDSYTSTDYPSKYAIFAEAQSVASNELDHHSLHTLMRDCYITHLIVTLRCGSAYKAHRYAWQPANTPRNPCLPKPKSI